MKIERESYPFVPKSTGWLRAGHFWALPLSDGSFGCGRVIEVPPVETRTSRVEFLAGVLNWHSSSLPTYELIAGAGCIRQGSAHLRAITRTGGEILGFRELGEDMIEPWLFRGAVFWKNSQVTRGLVAVRSQTIEDNDLPVLSTWGYNFACLVAEEHFVRNSG